MGRTRRAPALVPGTSNCTGSGAASAQGRGPRSRGALRSVPCAYPWRPEHGYRSWQDTVLLGNSLLSVETAVARFVMPAGFVYWDGSGVRMGRRAGEIGAADAGNWRDCLPALIWRRLWVEYEAVYWESGVVVKWSGGVETVSAAPESSVAGFLTASQRRTGSTPIRTQWCRDDAGMESSQRSVSLLNLNTKCFHRTSRRWVWKVNHVTTSQSGLCCM